MLHGERFIKHRNFKPEQNHNLGHPGVYDRIIFKQFLNTRKVTVSFNWYNAEMLGEVFSTFVKGQKLLN
jgi:hypothetical protein